MREPVTAKNGRELSQIIYWVRYEKLPDMQSHIR